MKTILLVSESIDEALVKGTARAFPGGQLKMDFAHLQGDRYNAHWCF